MLANNPVAVVAVPALLAPVGGTEAVPDTHGMVVTRLVEGAVLLTFVSAEQP